MNTLFDGVYQRLDRLESEYVALRAAVERIERRLGSADSEHDKPSIQQELQDLRGRVAELQRRIDELESASRN